MAPKVRFGWISDDHWGCIFAILELTKGTNWQPDNFRQGWPKAYHATKQRMGVFQFWGKIVG